MSATTTDASPTATAAPSPAPVVRPRRPWWQSAWVIPLVVLVGGSLAAPWISPYDPLAQLPDGLTNLGAPLPPSAHHWLGTDELGRDVVSRLFYGGRISLLISFFATLMAGVLGVTAGAIAGYCGGRVDNAIMRMTEVVMAFPALLLAIALASVLPPGAFSVILTLGLVGWTSLARVVRGNVLQLREQEFIEASWAVGAGHARILFQHVWPNVRPLAMTLLALKLADMLLLEAALGFLGLGVPPPAPTWGQLVGEGRSYFYHAPWLGLPAGFAIFLTVLSVNMLAERASARRGR